MLKQILRVLRRVLRGPAPQTPAQERAAQAALWVQRQQGAALDPSALWTGLPPEGRVHLAEGVQVSVGVEVYLDPDALPPPSVRIGREAYIGQYTNLGAYGDISIGDYAQIAPFCHILSGSHRFERRDVPIIRQGQTAVPVVIEEDVWLGTHVVVLPGVTIGRGAIVGAGSVVTKDIPPYEIWGGVPARYLKTRPE